MAPIATIIADLGETHAIVTSLTFTVVPEPTTAALLLMGLVALTRRRPSKERSSFQSEKGVRLGGPSSALSKVGPGFLPLVGCSGNSARAFVLADDSSPFGLMHKRWLWCSSMGIDAKTYAREQSDDERQSWPQVRHG